MLRKISMLALLLPTLFSAKAAAYSNNNDCNTCCDSQWNVYADWLYWKPRANSLDYAINGLNSNGSVFNVEPSYQSGFRVGFFYECNDLFYDLSYVRFHNSYSNAVAGAGLEETRAVISRQGTVTDASASWSFKYDTVDLLVGSDIHHNCAAFKTSFFGGLKLLFIDQNFTSSSSLSPTVGSNGSNKIKLDAYGVNFGVGMEYDFWSCLNFFTHISGDVLLGKFDRNITDVQLAGTSFNAEDNFWNMVSAINVMFGLNYDYKFNGCWCGNLGISLGYEFHQYFGISDWLAYDESSKIFQRNVQNLSLDGLFLRVSLGF